MPRKLKTLMVIALLAITTSTPAQGQQAERTRELYHIFDIKTQADRQAIIRALTDGMNINVSDSQTITPLGLVDKGYPEFDGCECDEAEVGFLGLVVACRDPAPVLEWLNSRSMRLRHLYLVRSCGAGLRRLTLAGITASAPAASISLQIASAS